MFIGWFCLFSDFIVINLLLCLVYSILLVMLLFFFNVVVVDLICNVCCCNGDVIYLFIVFNEIVYNIFVISVISVIWKIENFMLWMVVSLLFFDNCFRLIIFFNKVINGESLISVCGKVISIISIVWV